MHLEKVALLYGYFPINFPKTLRAVISQNNSGNLPYNGTSYDIDNYAVKLS